MLWSMAEREKVVKENPDLKTKEIMSKMGELWRGMSGALLLFL